MRSINRKPLHLGSAKTGRIVQQDTEERALEREVHGLMLSVKNNPALRNVQKKCVHPTRVICRYLRLLPPETSDALCLSLYRYNARRRGQDVPPTTGDAA